MKMNVSEETPQTDSSGEFRLCTGCSDLKPLDKFRRLSKGSEKRFAHCNSCHNFREQQRRAKLRSKADGVAFQKLATQYCLARSLRQRQLVWDLAMEDAGGFNQFLSRWHDAISGMTKAGRYTPRLLRLYEMLLEISRDIDRERADALAELPDHDLTDVVRSQLLQMVKETPQIAIDAAKQLGWKVEPMPPTESANA